MKTVSFLISVCLVTTCFCFLFDDFGNVLDATIPSGNTFIILTDNGGPTMFRTLLNEQITGGAQGSCISTGTGFSGQSTTGTIACSLTYNDPPTPLMAFDPPLDIQAVENSCDCWLLQDFDTDAAVTITAEAERASGPMETSSINVAAGGGASQVCIPFTNPANHDDVTVASVTIPTTGSFTMSRFCCATTVACRHFITMATPGMATVGESITISVVCENYAPTDQAISISYPFADGSKSMGMCDQGAFVPTVDATGLTVPMGILPSGASVTCSFMVLLDTATTIPESQAIITNVGSLTMSVTTESVTSTLGLAEQCNPPQPSASFQVAQTQMFGDPHLVGFAGQKFDFHGRPDAFFNLITTPWMVVNSQFVAADLVSPKKFKTYIGELGVRFKEGNIEVECHRASTGVETNVYINGKNVPRGTSVNVGQVHIKVSNRPNKRTTITTPIIKMSVRFSSSKHSSCHLNLRTKALFSIPDEDIHGVLGQTHHPDKYGLSGENDQGLGVIDGTWQDYIVEDLFATKFFYDLYQDREFDITVHTDDRFQSAHVV
mmetsp:Transcript_13126/g.14546  ORF Transcript_13126/g.14546 Transcript_13126/m.14546 type:complete len:550 (-) Transcript_13126:103-1752(-)